ncbi:hypothetical protein D3C86_1142580 [compost metagenome]
MDNNQVTQRRHSDPDRQRQTDDGDQGVRHQVADHRQQAEQERQHDQGFGQRQLDTEHRQHHRQENPGEDSVEQGNLDLGEHDVAKRLDQQAQAFEQRRSQRFALGQVRHTLQGNDRTQHHADQQGHEHVRRVLAHQLQITEVFADPFANRHAELRGTGRQIGVDERRQLPARAVDHSHELVEGRAGVFRLVQQEAEGTGKDQRQHADNQSPQQRHRQPARAPAFDQPLQLRGEHVDQFEHEQPGEQAGQQPQRQDQQQSAKNDDPADDQQDLTLRKRWHTASKTNGVKRIGSLPAIRCEH